MAWRLNRALTNFRAAVDRAYPNRDRTSDGTIGDAAHQASVSDHNPDPDGTVDAWDMDVNLRSGDDRAAIEMLKRVFQRHPAARYWIHNREIAHRSDGWVRRRYTGSNPHDQHIHWNSNQATENSTAPWILEVPDMAAIDDVLRELRALRAKVDSIEEKTAMLYSVVHDGDRGGDGRAVTRDGGVPVAWGHRAAWELGKGLTAVKEQLSSLSGLSAPAVTQEMLTEAIRTVLREGVGDSIPRD
jgi:hypothetical protein